MIVNPKSVETIMRDVAKRIILPRFRALGKADIFTKSSETDLVTIADRESEEELERTLTVLEPGSAVIGEEGIAAGRTSTAMLNDKSGTVWVVDPIDGTWNFVHGKDEFAVMVARVVGGKTVQGWIYDVPADRMLYAQDGQGTHIDGVRHHVASAKLLRDTIGFCGARYFSNEKRSLIKDFARKVHSLHSFGCAGHEYLNIVSGKYDFAIYNRGQQWDHLPGALAVREAGGLVCTWTGAPYTPQSDLSTLVAVSNQSLLEYLRKNLLDDLDT